MSGQGALLHWREASQYPTCNPMVGNPSLLACANQRPDSVRPRGVDRGRDFFRAGSGQVRRTFPGPVQRPQTCSVHELRFAVTCSDVAGPIAETGVPGEATWAKSMTAHASAGAIRHSRLTARKACVRRKHSGSRTWEESTCRQKPAPGLPKLTAQDGAPEF